MVERDVVFDEDELRALTIEAHRAIGRYVVSFSQVIYQMRVLAGSALTAQDELASLALGQATAQQIADSFFGMCRFSGELAADEINIANRLQTEIGERITERNKIMHGDWWVGGSIGGFRDILERARLFRVYPNARDGDFNRVDNYSIDDLDTISDRLIELRVLVSDFGRGALRLSMFRVDLTWSDSGAYRVSDILVARDLPRSGKGGTIVREGPRASELYAGPLFG